MISKEDLFNSDFLKQFKDGKEFDSFMKELFIRGTEKILKQSWIPILAMTRMIHQGTIVVIPEMVAQKSV